MSKFLKFIIALILIVFIGSGAALIVPPFFGVDTVVVDGNTDSDLAVGTTVFTRTLDRNTLSAGTKVLTQDGNSAYIRTIRSYDAESGFAESEDGQALYFTDNYRKALFSVPLIGYLSIATQTKMGLIILLLILAFVVILFIISEFLRKAPEEDDDEDDDDEESFYSDLVEKKRRRDERGSGADRKEQGRPAVEMQDIEAPAEEPVIETAAVAAAAVPQEEAQFRDIFEEHETVSLDDGEAEKEALPDVEAALEAALENQQLGRTETISLPPETMDLQATDEFPTEELELAIPAFTVEELIQKAYAEGKDPTVIQDETTGVTLVDYSECI